MSGQSVKSVSRQQLICVKNQLSKIWYLFGIPCPRSHSAFRVWISKGCLLTHVFSFTCSLWKCTHLPHTCPPFTLVYSVPLQILHRCSVIKSSNLVWWNYMTLINHIPQMMVLNTLDAEASQISTNTFLDWI